MKKIILLALKNIPCSNLHSCWGHPTVSLSRQPLTLCKIRSPKLRCLWIRAITFTWQSYLSRYLHWILSVMTGRWVVIQDVQPEIFKRPSCHSVVCALTFWVMFLKCKPFNIPSWRSKNSSIQGLTGFKSWPSSLCWY